MSDAIVTVAHLPRHRTTDPSAWVETYEFSEALESAPVSARGASGAIAALDQDAVIESWLGRAKLRDSFGPPSGESAPGPDLAA